MSIMVDFRKKLSGFTLNAAFSFEEGRTGLLGESGSGKSMTLKCIAGIETPDEGIIKINGVTVFDSTQRVNLPPQQRKCGYLFQNYALFPHLTVRENILIAQDRFPKEQRRETTNRLICTLGLEGLESSKASRISGGQQQRLALARMLAAEPEIILLDEPFSALDATIKKRVEDELSVILEDFTGSILFVSHNRDEVFRFCKSLVILDKGRITDSGTTAQVFNEPSSISGALLTGCSNISRILPAGDTRIALPEWGLLLDTGRRIPEGVTHAGIHAHHIREKTPTDMENCGDFLRERVCATPYSETWYLSALTAPGFAGGTRERRLPLLREIPVDTPRHNPSNDRVTLCIPPEKILLLRP